MLGGGRSASGGAGASFEHRSTPSSSNNYYTSFNPEKPTFRQGGEHFHSGEPNRVWPTSPESIKSSFNEILNKNSTDIGQKSSPAPSKEYL
jgi:hypothetical protein